MSTKLTVNEEIDHLITLCTYISQLSSRIRLMQLSNRNFSPEYIKFYQQELLSMSEKVEGSAVLLESLLAIERPKSVPNPSKTPRYCYTREELLKLRQSVPLTLSNQMKNLLTQVIERETKESNKSWRDIRTILT